VDQETAGIVLDKLLQGDVVCHCPDLILYELGNVLAGKTDDPIAGLRAFLGLPIRLHQPVIGWLSVAATLAGPCRISFYDASFAALARDLGVPLITADRKLARIVGAGARLLADMKFT
jgi:predicted nucleic acid-binding protein